jgi:hypothetical protein
MTGGRSSRHCGRVGNVTVRGRVRARLGSGKLLKEAALGIVGERGGRLASDNGSAFKTHFFAFEVTLKRVEEETVVRDGEPEKRQGSNALVEDRRQRKHV